VTERQRLGAKLDPALREWADRVVPTYARINSSGLLIERKEFERMSRACSCGSSCDCRSTKIRRRFPQ